MNNLNKQGGQAFVGGLVLMMVLLFFSVYFLYVSESYFRLFSNAEQANNTIVRESSVYANILNEIAMNNQNIIAAITVSENALLKAMEYSIYMGFHQPYWQTYSMLQDKTLSPNSSKKSDLSVGSEHLVANTFQSYALTSARGFFIAKSLAEKNAEILKKLPVKIQKYFMQSSNAQVRCFALETQDKYYHAPGIINLPVPKIYSYHLQRVERNKCVIEHKLNVLDKFLEYTLPVLYSSEKDRVLDYVQLENLSLTKNYQYGIHYVDPSKKFSFINDLNFTSPSLLISYDKKFSIVEKFLSHIKFFKNIHLNEEKKLLKSSLSNHFMITHKLIYCAHSIVSSCFIPDEQFLRSFFYPNWSVTGVY